jgi:hypothetical protein
VQEGHVLGDKLAAGAPGLGKPCGSSSLLLLKLDNVLRKTQTVESDTD